jgi:hypothetical protein
VAIFGISLSIFSASLSSSPSSSSPSGDTYFFDGALVGGIVGRGAGLGAKAFVGDAVVVALVVLLPSSAFAFASSSAMMMGVDASIEIGGVRTNDDEWAATAAPAD